MTNDLQTLKQAYEKWVKNESLESFCDPNEQIDQWPLIEGLLSSCISFKKLYGQSQICAKCESGAGDGHIVSCQIKQSLQDFKTKIGVSDEN